MSSPRSSPEEGSVSELLQLVGRTHFLVVARLRSLLPCCHWGAISGTGHVAPSISVIETSLVLNPSDFLFYRSAFKECIFWVRLTWIISISQGQLIWDFNDISKIFSQHFLDKCLTELPEDKNVEGPFLQSCLSHLTQSKLPDFYKLFRILL